MNPNNLVRQGDRYYNPSSGKYDRYRRGKLVEIPIEWVNKVTTPATIRRRHSKLTRKLRLKLKACDTKDPLARHLILKVFKRKSL